MHLAPVLLCFACFSASEDGPPPVSSVTSKARPGKGNTESYLFVQNGMEIRFWVSIHMHMSLGVQCNVEAITLTEAGGKEPFQQIPIADMLCPCPTPDGQFPAVEMMDFDFDGSPDVRIMRAAQDLTVPEHRYWRWNAAARSFVNDAVLDSLQQPQFDQERHMVSSQWYASGTHRGGSNFRYEEGRLTMVSNMEKFVEGDQERWVIWGMKEGKLQPVQEKSVPLHK